MWLCTQPVIHFFYISLTIIVQQSRKNSLLQLHYKSILTSTPQQTQLTHLYSNHCLCGAMSLANPTASDFLAERALPLPFLYLFV